MSKAKYPTYAVTWFMDRDTFMGCPEEALRELDEFLISVIPDIEDE